MLGHRAKRAPPHSSSLAAESAGPLQQDYEHEKGWVESLGLNLEPYVTEPGERGQCPDGKT